MVEIAPACGKTTRVCGSLDLTVKAVEFAHPRSERFLQKALLLARIASKRCEDTRASLGVRPSFLFRFPGIALPGDSFK